MIYHLSLPINPTEVEETMEATTVLVMEDVVANVDVTVKGVVADPLK